MSIHYYMIICAYAIFIRVLKYYYKNKYSKKKEIYWIITPFISRLFHCFICILYVTIIFYFFWIITLLITLPDIFFSLLLKSVLLQACYMINVWGYLTCDKIIWCVCVYKCKYLEEFYYLGHVSILWCLTFILRHTFTSLFICGLYRVIRMIYNNK